MVTAAVDHLVVGSADLDVGVAWVAARLGVAPVPGGSHRGVGTRNALLGLGAQYLEVLAVDPAQPGVTSPLAAEVASRSVPALINVVVGVDDLDAAITLLRSAGVGCSDPVPMSRVRPDGVRLAWELAFPEGSPAFLIDWKDTERPSRDLPDGGRITSLRITTPVPAMFATFGIEATAGPWHVEAFVNGIALA